MIRLKKTNQKSIEIQQTISANSMRETSVEIKIPKTLDFSSEYSSVDFFNTHITQNKALYKSKNPSLTLLYTKYLEKKDLPVEQLNTSLSLFSHQFIQKINDNKSLIEKANPEDVKVMIADLLSELQKILGSFRDLTFSDETSFQNFEKIDFLLSFETEQFLLRMVSVLQKVKDSKELRMAIIMIAESEKKHRISKKYHSEDFDVVKGNNDNFIRILNRIEMRKRIVELPLKIYEKVTRYGKREKYISIGIATGIIMFFVSFIIMQARLFGMDSTIQFVIGLAVLYVCRDLFKEEFKDYIYNKIISRKPIIRSFVYVPNSSEAVGITRTWFTKEDRSLLNQNKKVNYKDKISLMLKEKIHLTNFEHYGFKKMKTSIIVDFRPIMNMIERDDRKLFVYLYGNDSSKVFKLPRQYKIDIILKERVRNKKKYFKIKEDIVEKEKKFTIILDREKIISIKEK